MAWSPTSGTVTVSERPLLNPATLEHLLDQHHTKLVPIGAAWTLSRRIAIPDRVRPFWRRWKVERWCRQSLGHCWHPTPASMIGWDCCECGKFTEGMPAHDCALCSIIRTDAIMRGNRRG